MSRLLISGFWQTKTQGYPIINTNVTKFDAVGKLKLLNEKNRCCHTDSKRTRHPQQAAFGTGADSRQGYW